MTRLPQFLATLGGVGYLPFAPGTWGSLVGLALAWAVRSWAWEFQMVYWTAWTAIAIWATQQVCQSSGASDPQDIVIDEMVGMGVALIGVGWSFPTAVGGFLLFRLFDVLKPGPIRSLEKLKGGWGVVADDIAAGLLTNVLLRVIIAWC